MRRGVLPAAGLVALLLLAGCAEDAGGPGGSASGSPTSQSQTSTTAPPTPTTVLDLLLAFSFTDCHGLTAQVTRPVEDVQALLPEGFTAKPGQAGTGTLLVDILLCGNITTPAVTVPSIAVGMVAASIERPTGRVPGAPDVPAQEYVFRVLAGDDLLAKVWPAAGYDMRNGTASRVSFEDTGPGRAGFSGIGAEYTVLGTGATAVPAAPRTQAFARYTMHGAGDGSVLAWTGTYALTPAAAGVGYVEVAGDDVLARFAPPERSVLPALVGHVEGGSMDAQDLRRIFT